MSKIRGFIAPFLAKHFIPFFWGGVFIVSALLGIGTELHSSGIEFFDPIAAFANSITFAIMFTLLIVIITFNV